MLLVGSALKGYAIDTKDGRIGTVTDLLFDDTNWKIRWLVVDTGTWLTTRKVLVHPSAVAGQDLDRHELFVALSKEQIERSPSILRDQPVSLQTQSNLCDYYGWDPIWGHSYFDGGAIASPLSAPPFLGASSARNARDFGLPADDGDPHLRSINAVKGYHIRASDGEIGHVENLLIEDASWTIRYLIVDTSNWWLGKHVLISPYSVHGISHDDRQIEIDVTRDKVKSSPPWDPAAMITEYYEKRLHGHYGWAGYGW